MKMDRPPLDCATHAIGIDVGGTKVAGGLVNLTSGALSLRQQIPTNPERGGQALLDDVIRMTLAIQADAPKATAIGVGVAELVSPDGRIFSGYRIPWDGRDIAADLSAILPTTVESDVRAAALAEAHHGAGRPFDQFYYVTIGTGVSGTLVLEGRPFTGARGAALVIANGAENRTCPSCGKAETLVLEDIASGPALAAAAGQPDAASALAAATRGDTRAARAIKRATQELGHTLALLAGALDPQALVIGGGLGSAPGPYFDALARAIRAGLWDGDTRDLPILRAATGPDAGIIGAALSTTHQKPAHRPATAT
jgi:glucokinase